MNRFLWEGRSDRMRWDFVSSENSTGFHSQQEAARIIAVSVGLARQAELEAVHYKYWSQKHERNK